MRRLGCYLYEVMMGKVLVTLFLCYLSSSFLDAKLTMGLFASSCDTDQDCVEIRNCPYFEQLLSRAPIPRPRNVVRTIRGRQCGFYRNTPYVCCDKAPPTTTTTTTTATTTATEDPPTTELPLFEGLNASPIDSHPNFEKLANDVCGPIMTNSRITSGSRTAINEFPWMALIAYYVDGEIDFRCGGTLINERYVLTAAHCILNSTIVGVRLGEHNLDTSEDCEDDHCASPTQDFYIEAIHVHPGYDQKTLVNDIALIRLAKPANLSNENVQPICLPTKDLDLSGKYAVVSGWGVTENGLKSPELLKVSLPVLPLSACRGVYRRFAPVTEDQICAGGSDGRDSCGGDSGGPMQYVGVVGGAPRFVQYGIVSYGPRYCGSEGKPGVYTKVSRYVRWILDTIR